MNNIRNFAILSSLIVGLLSLGSCKEKSSDVKVFSLQKSDFHSWSELISVEKVIQLQENDSCLMSYAAKCIVTDRNIIFQDYKAMRIYSFSADGKFICQIGELGHAESEFTNIRDLCLGSNDSVVMVLDEKGVVCYGNYDGRFLERKEFSSDAIEYEKIAPVGNSGFLCFTANQNDNSVVYASKTEQKGLRESKRYHFVSNPFYSYNDICRVISDYGDFYIDTYNGGSLETIYKIDLGSDALPDDVLPTTYKEFDMVDSSPSYFKCITEAQETSGYLYLKLVGPKQEYYLAFIDKNDGRYAFGKEDMNMGMSVIGTQDDSFCAIIYPEYATPDSFAKKILTRYKIAPDKNSPVIVKFRLSENALSD